MPPTSPSALPATSPRRAELHQRQLALIEALQHPGPPHRETAPPHPLPNPERLAIQRRALLRKRAGEIAQHLPRTRRALGAGFTARLLQHLEQNQPPTPAASRRRQALAFARTLPARALDAAAAAEIALLSLMTEGRMLATCRFAAAPGSPEPRLRTLFAVRVPFHPPLSFPLPF